jgi:hypothetical protein
VIAGKKLIFLTYLIILSISVVMKKIIRYSNVRIVALLFRDRVLAVTLYDYYGEELILWQSSEKSQ